MSILNRTPFPAIAFRQYNLAGDLNGVVSVRGTFKLVQDGALALAAKQEPLELADLYNGDPHETDLLRQSDLVPFKPGTDVTFVGAAFTSDGEPARTWTCGLSVGPVTKNLRVYGEREWKQVLAVEEKGFLGHRLETRRTGWKMGEPRAEPYVVLSWEKAFGGKIPSAPGAGLERNLSNPNGRGIVNEMVTAEIETVPAPQIEAIDRPVTDWRKQYEPENIAPIPPFWRQRQRLAGTYDDDWLKKRHPLLPADFDFRFWQCAHPDLISEPWLNGDEEFELRNLLYLHRRINGTLPGVRLRMQLPRGEAMGVTDFVLDGVHFDMRPGVGRVFLTWRAGFPWPDGDGLPEIIAYDPLPEAV
jgi:hypothetical protein